MRASDVKTITYMKTHSAELIEINKKRSPIVTTRNGAPRAVMMDVESDERLQDTLILLKMLSQSEEDFRKGRWISQAQIKKTCANGWAIEAPSSPLVG